MKRLDRLGFSIQGLENVMESINEALKNDLNNDIFNEYGLDLVKVACYIDQVKDELQEGYDDLDDRRYKILNSIEALNQLKDDLFKVQDLDDDDITEDLKDFIDDEIDEFENALNGRLKDLNDDLDDIDYDDNNDYDSNDLDDDLDDLMIELLSGK